MIDHNMLGNAILIVAMLQFLTIVGMGALARRGYNQIETMRAQLQPPLPPDKPAQECQNHARTSPVNESTDPSEAKVSPEAKVSSTTDRNRPQALES